MEKKNSAAGGLLGKISAKTRTFFVELFLIVAGILIALAIDEWRQEIEEAQREQVFLRQLVNDLVATESQMEAAAKRTLKSEQAAGKIVDSFEGGRLPGLAELAEWLAAIRYVDNPVPVLGTAETLVSTGDLRLISQIEARSNITAYLSRSRDFWLVPLYQLEDSHGVLYQKLLAEADEFGIVPSFRKGRINSEDADIVGFFSSSRAFTVASKLSETKQAMVAYRSSMLREATDLKESLGPLLQPD